MPKKYIDADHLKVEIEKHIKEIKDAAEKFTPNMGFFYAKLSGIYDVMALIDSLQQEQPKKYIELNGIKYREVPAKTNDKICKDCDYFLDNGTCELVDCPCIDDNTILERLNEQLDVDLEKDVESWFFNEISSKINVENTMYYYFQECARRFYELGLNARKEE